MSDQTKIQLYKLIFLSLSCNLVLWYELQRVPINIVHGKIADYLKSQPDKQIKFYSILKPMVLFIIGEKFKKIHQCKPEISLII